jgi:hypothetical protein
MGRRSEEKERHWRRHLKSQAASRLSVRAYCQRERLSEVSFYAWRRELPRRGATGLSSRLASIATSACTEYGPDASSGAGKFLPVTIAADHEPVIEIALPRGILVRVWAGAPAALMRDLLAVLAPNSADSPRQAAAEARSC